MIDLKNKNEIDGLLKAKNQLFNKNFELEVEINRLKGVIFDLEDKNKALLSGQSQEPTMYEVMFQSDNTDKFVLDLPFIPQKGNVFEFVSPLISINSNHGNDDYFLKVKSVGVSIDKDGKISNIEAWCKSY